MSISLVQYSFAERVQLLRDFLRPIHNLLIFAQKDHDDLNEFLIQIQEKHTALTQSLVFAKRTVEGRLSEEDIITKTMANLIDATVEYLSFVKLQDALPFEQWIDNLRSSVEMLHNEYNVAIRIVRTVW